MKQQKQPCRKKPYKKQIEHQKLILMVKNYRNKVGQSTGGIVLTPKKNRVNLELESVKTVFLDSSKRNNNTLFNVSFYYKCSKIIFKSLFN